MNTELEDLLTQLEQVSAQAAEISNPALNGTVDSLQVLNFIHERGELIERLQPVLAARTPVSYSEWNRLVVIHHQGRRIQETLNAMRQQVALELGVNSSGRILLERVTGMIAPAPE